MNVTIIGYGKMGKEIENVLISRGHNINKIIDKDSEISFENTEVAIIFTSPESTFEQIKNCLDANVRVVCGSTGWTQQLDEIENYCRKSNGGFLYSPNFSIGVNLFYKLNDYLNEIMTNHKNYSASILEKHHSEKVDKPSGTAIKIANDIISKSDYNSWTLNENENKDMLKIRSVREGDQKGHHSVIFSSDDDIIRISHTAKSRFAFALGAVISAEFLVDKNGVYDMSDVINSLKK
jgi:4-hydroxy-tetrahydrodipicolinate reductase|tara:strand:- start:1446 stop:2153 length:708 start_codon:yes stop_codon:yes gene_type:complete